MNVSVVGCGIVLLVIGAVVFVMAYNRVSELQSFVGQLARSMSPSLQNEYVLYQLYEILFGLVAMGGLGFVVAGVVMKEKPRLGSSLASPSRPAPITTFPQTYCHKCGAQLGEEDLYCRKCGAVVSSH